jgi:hypothetical protein
MNNEEFLGYVDLHSKTERALFNAGMIRRLYALAGIPCNIDGNGLFSLASWDAAPLVSQARERLRARALMTITSPPPACYYVNDGDGPMLFKTLKQAREHAHEFFARFATETKDCWMDLELTVEYGVMLPMSRVVKMPPIRGSKNHKWSTCYSYELIDAPDELTHLRDRLSLISAAAEEARPHIYDFLSQSGACEKLWAALYKTAAPPQLNPSSPQDIRERGWVVAVHNDYKIDGAPHTFWLFTKDGRAVKGEGLTDADALDLVRQEIAKLDDPMK